MHRKNLAKRINTMLTILCSSCSYHFSHHFCQKMQMEELLGKCKPDSGNRGGCGHAFLHCRKGDKRRCKEECIKAQCVIARTNLKAAEEMGTELPGSMTMGELQERGATIFPRRKGR